MNCSFCQTKTPQFTEETGNHAFCNKVCQTGFYNKIGILLYNPETGQDMPIDLIVKQLVALRIEDLLNTYYAFPELKHVFDSNNFESQWLNSFTKKNMPDTEKITNFLNNTDISSERKLRIRFVLIREPHLPSSLLSSKLIEYALQYSVFTAHPMEGTWLLINKNTNLFIKAHKSGMRMTGYHLVKIIDFENNLAFEYILKDPNFDKQYSYEMTFIKLIEKKKFDMAKLMLKLGFFDLYDDVMLTITDEDMNQFIEKLRFTLIKR
jgi:hypothetical protein